MASPGIPRDTDSLSVQAEKLSQDTKVGEEKQGAVWGKQRQDFHRQEAGIWEDAFPEIRFQNLVV
jgi:hypothetical protein